MKGQHDDVAGHSPQVRAEVSVVEGLRNTLHAFLDRLSNLSSSKSVPLYSSQSIFLGFQEFSIGLAEYAPNRHRPELKPASLLAELLASTSSAPVVTERCGPADSLSRAGVSSAPPAPDSFKCECGLDADHECCVPGVRGCGCDAAGARGRQAKGTRPMDIPLHTYYRDPRQVRERQRLWAALVSYRVQQERTELERRHIQLSNAQQQELQQEQER